MSNLYKSYPHGEEEGRGMMCNPRAAIYCSACGAGNSIAWICRHKDEVENSYTVAKKIYDKWMKEKWYNYESEAPHLKAMIDSLK